LALGAVREHLLTEFGVRTLSPEDPKYRGCAAGDIAARSQSLHQGTVFPFLLGLYADASFMLHGPQAVGRELGPVLQALEKHFLQGACLFAISEMFDGDAPHTPRGAPASLASTAELHRVLTMVKA
jgi:4-alpha-glucanotransferase